MNKNALFINPEMVIEHIIDENIYFPNYYLTLGEEMRNAHALVAMKNVIDHFNKHEKYEMASIIQTQINIFFKKEKPKTEFNNIDINNMAVAPKSIKEATDIIKNELFKGQVSTTENFAQLNKIDPNINVAKHYSALYYPIIYDFVVVDSFSNENRLMNEFIQNGIENIDEMIYSLIKTAVVNYDK